MTLWFTFVDKGGIFIYFFVSSSDVMESLPQHFLGWGADLAQMKMIIFKNGSKYLGYISYLN